MKRKVTFTRELFILFYLLFFGATFLSKISGNILFSCLKAVADYSYMPAMFFAAAYDIGYLDEIYERQEDFRNKLLKKALVFMIHFYAFGFFKDVFMEKLDPLPTIKQLLSLVRIPTLGQIFLSIAAIYLIAALGWKSLMKCTHRKWIIIAASVIGLLFIFMPAGLMGYGLIGIFTGGDGCGAAPIFPYLGFIFIGAYLGTKEKLPVYEKKYILSAIIPMVLGALLRVAGFNTAAIMVFGIFLAWVGIVICYQLYPIYIFFEKIIYGFVKKRAEGISSFYNKKQSSRAFRTIFYLLGYTVLFTIMALFIYSPHIHYAITLIWEPDGVGQYLPKVYRFMEYIPAILKDLLHGNMNFKQYDFTNGLGSTIAISYDPIYWLYLLFNPSQIETVYSLMIVLRFYLAGLSFSALILYFEGSHFAAYLTSMVYAFSGYAIFAGSKHGQFITPLILLPLLIIAMENLIRERKWYLMSILVAVSLLCSYYFLYMNTIGIGIYFVVRILCTKEYRNFKTFFTRGLIIVGSYVLGSCMGIISLFTSFASYMGSSRTEGGGLDDFLSNTILFYRPQWISDALVSFISASYNAGLWLKLGFAPLCFLSIVLLFTRKTKKELKPLFVITTLFCIFPIFGYIFSGFSSVNNRWCYMYACLMAFILAQVLDKFADLSNRELKIMTGLTLFVGGIIFFSVKYHTEQILGPYGLLCCTLIILYIINQKNPSIAKKAVKPILFAATMLAILFNANLYIAQQNDADESTHLEAYVPVGSSHEKLTFTGLRYLDQVTDDDEEFYRSTNVRTVGNVRNSSMILGYNDISTFSSTLSNGIVDYNSAMGNCDWDIVSIYDYNARTILNELASVKYLSTRSDETIALPYGYKQIFSEDTETRTWYLYENEYALPLGYTYNNVMTSEEASSYSAAQKQELTMTTAIVNNDNDVDNSNLTSTAPALTGQKIAIDINNVDMDGVTIDPLTGMLVITPGATMTFHFDGIDNAETYLCLKGDLFHEKDATEYFIKTDISAKGMKYQYKFRIDSYSTGQDEYLFNLGYHEDSIESCKLTFQDKGQIAYEDIAIYLQPMDSYPAQAEALKANSLENVKTDTNMVSGDITVDNDRMLCITLPYQKGWTAYVDGQKTTIQRVNYQYMGLNLTKGTHHIEMKFQLPGIRYAFLITGAGIAVFLLIIIFNLIRKRLRVAKK